MEQMEWKLVPAVPTAEMVGAGAGVVFREDDCEADEEPYRARGQAIDAYTQMLAVAPEPPHLSMTKEEAATFQDWRGMDGACAFHLIDRHANGWGDTARMMEAWLAANAAPSNLLTGYTPWCCRKSRTPASESELPDRATLRDLSLAGVVVAIRPENRNKRVLRLSSI